MKPHGPDRLLIVSRSAGKMNPDAEAKLRAGFADDLIVDFDPKVDFTKLIKRTVRVVVAGGDGTVEYVVRRLADGDHPLGILPLGTFNNLAHALGLPDDLDEAIEVTRSGRPRPITLGRVNGRVFVKACAIGLFGEAIASWRATAPPCRWYSATPRRSAASCPSATPAQGNPTLSFRLGLDKATSISSGG